MSFAKDFTRAVLNDTTELKEMLKAGVQGGFGVGCLAFVYSGSPTIAATFAAATAVAIPTVRYGYTAAKMGAERVHTALMEWSNK